MGAVSAFTTGNYQCKPVITGLKDVRDRKILRTEFLESSVYYYSSYTWLKIAKKN